MACLTRSMLENVSDYIPDDMLSIQLFVAKFATTMATHLKIFPIYNESMVIMKYVNNHPTKFDKDILSITLAFVVLMFSFVFELLNLVVLFSRVNVYFAIGSFVTLSVLVDLQKFYFVHVIDSDPHNKLKEVYNESNRPQITNWNHTITFNKRPLVHKWFRIVYKFARLIYVSMIYYFIPFGFLLAEQYTIFTRWKPDK